MKNFSSHWIKRLFFMCLFVSGYMTGNALQFTANDYHIVFENTTDGWAAIDIDRYDDGNQIENYLYLEAYIDGIWVWLIEIYHYYNPGNLYHTEYHPNYPICFIQDLGQTTDTDGDGDTDEYVSRYFITASPTGDYNVPVLFRLKEVNGDQYAYPATFNLTFYKPNAPRNLTVSQNLCNKIDLSWTAPDNIRDNGTNVYHIYRNGSLYKNNITATNYSDTSVDDGTTYNYKVKLVTSYANTRQTVANHGEFTIEMSGNSKPVPVAPTNVAATSNRCDGNINVTWQWTGELPSNFEIQRSTSATGTYTTLSSTLPGDRNYYLDSPPLPTTNYYYKVKAKNNCDDWGALSSAAEGMGLEGPAAPTNFAYTIVNNTVRLSWTDNANNETGYILKKINVTSGVSNEYQLSANTTTYNDSELEICVPYTYTLKSVNSCGSSSSVTRENIGLTPDLSNTFTAGSFKASKGYYPDMVHLEWDNNNRFQIELFHIFRKEYGSQDSVLITTVDGTARTFDDRYAENSVLYEYSIKGEGLCNEVSVFSNVTSDIGFKTPTATIHGKVTYQDDNPVKDVILTAESEELPAFSSISLNGTTSYMQIDNLVSSLPAFTFQAYIRFDVVEDAAIFNRGSQYKLNYQSGAFVFDVGGNTLSFTYIPPVDTFVQVTTVYDGSASYIYIDGELKAKKTGVSAPASSTDSFILGKAGSSLFFDGYIDEIRLWESALDSAKVVFNYNKYINGNETGMMGYYRLNENVPVNMFFDLSRIGSSYNENHGTLYNCSYANVNPFIEQLWFRSKTDETGNYLITGIPYLSGGSVYKIVPMMSPHQFNPAYKTLFVGDGATVHNDINFVDISTVTVTVEVFYENTAFPVKEVWVKLDGQVQVDNNEQIVQTKEDGTVSLEVPIGNHYLSFEKQNHTFEQAYYPGLDESGNILRHNFSQPLNVQITDTTKVKLAGKIVGGPVEAAKDLLSNIHPTNNNIGSVDIQLTTERGFIIDMSTSSTTVSVTTDAETGYFELWLLPEKYKPDGQLAIKNDLYTFNSDEDLALIDLTSAFMMKYETDSIYVDNVFSRLDTTALYNHRRDWIYRSEPEFSVLNKDGGKILGASEFIYENDGVLDTIPLAVEQGDTIFYPFGKPVFFFGNEYSVAFHAYESYENADNAAIDQVSVTDGQLLIYNNLAYGEKYVELYLDDNGKAEYTFLTDFPNIADPFTKNLAISFKAGPTIVQWPEGGATYDAYILGGMPTGNNFVTTGPSVVDYILRDPPGSGSSSTLQKGYVTVESHNWSVTNTTELVAGLAYQMGVQITTVAGSPFFMIQTQFETDNFIKGTIGSSFAGGTGYNQSTTLKFDEAFSTSDDPSFVGSDGDVFIGHSTNIIYGISKIMEIMPKEEVETGADTIAKNDSYAISISNGLRVNPEFDTYFIYSQRIIEEEQIPHLIKLRNIILEDTCYQKVFTDINDPHYGSNNDDMILWGSEASDDLYNGRSYIFTPPNDTIVDSVRYYNSQIANWIEILAMNESQKLNGLADDKHRNISFGAGSVYQSSIGSEDSYVDKTTFGFAVSEEFAMSLGFSANKIGFRLDASVKNTTAGQEEWSEGTTETRNVSYTLSDQNANNYITVDVLKCQSGNGPIFKTRGGQTSCPYEGEELTQYYDPGNRTLNFATMKIEGMQIAVDNPVSPLTPETSPALFTIRLSNVSEAEKDNWYVLGVDIASNPYGAKIKMDGSTINEGIVIMVPYGETITKTLEVWKGRDDVNDYENLIVYLGSTCDDLQEEIAISAYFAPACSKVDFEYPGKGWIINAEDNDTMLVIASGYNLQHEGFEDFHFQYTPTGTSNWTTTRIFTNDPLEEGQPNTTYLNGATNTEFYWDMSSLPDRGYDIRLVSHCDDGSVNYSEVLSGILDGNRPQVFGTPQPADGILDVDDNILVQFNEPIESGLLTQQNFNVRGTLNNYPIEHQSFLRFDGYSGFCDISDGLSFNDKSVTVEFWMRTNDYSNSVILSQGSDPANSFEIGLLDGEQTYFKIGNREYIANLQSTQEVPTDEWQHMAYVYDYQNGDVFIYQNDTIIFEIRSEQIEMNTSGKIFIGKSSVNGGDYFSGDIHELRIWSKTWSIGEIYANQYTSLTGYEVALYGYWPMNDAYGPLATDHAASRHMNVNANWVVEPGGNSWSFSGDNFLEFYTGYFAIIPEMDYTVEFWFKSDMPTDTICLFSNEKGDGNEGEGYLDKALSIFATPDGRIWVASRGNVFEASSNNYFDNSWHHFALVLRRRGNVASYIDGQVQNEKENTILGGIANDKMYLGVMKWDNTGGTGEDHYFSGKIDEFRIWNMAKTVTQIRLDMNSKLNGDEFGLMVYFPFEKYVDDGFGNMILSNSLENYVSDAAATDAVPVTAGGFSTDAPNIKDVRPVEDIAFDFVAAEDKIIILPKDYLMPQLEKNIIEIAVEGVEDKYGNAMASGVTWTAYVHRNQVRWEDERRYFTKEVYQPLEFVASIKNTGGQQVGFSILNLPSWLTAKPSVGVINPESSLDITFTVNPALNIGEYTNDIILRTENGFDEKLQLTIGVYKKPPDWKIDPSRFENSMNIVAKVKIDGVFSTDIFDMLAAFQKGTDSIRGVSNVRYIEEFDSYLVFLTVYGNNMLDKKVADSLDFLIWDASAGQILDNVIPSNIVLIDNYVLGTTVNPVIFESTGYSRHHIVLKEGWNWVSFNKLSPDRFNINSFLWALEPSSKDIIKTHGGSYSLYNGSSGGWSSGITYIDFMRMYQIKIWKQDTIIFSGTDIVPEDNPIPLVTGWNHIGYLPDLTMDVSEALRNFSPNESDLVKSQTGFAMYDSRTGWLGTLEVMQPGDGYMMKVNGTAQLSLTYPNTTSLKSVKTFEYKAPPPGWENEPSQFENNLSIVAKLDLGNFPDIKINHQMSLGAFIDGECRGFTTPLQTSATDYDPFFLNVCNNGGGGQKIEFRLYDGLTGNQYLINEIKPFVSDAVYGTIPDPMVLTLKGLMVTGNRDQNIDSYLRCYPNPFNDEVTVEFSESMKVKSIDVITANGSLIKNIYLRHSDRDITNRVKWNGTNEFGAEVASGMYYIKVLTENNVETIKISKTK